MAKTEPGKKVTKAINVIEKFILDLKKNTESVIRTLQELEGDTDKHDNKEEKSE